MRPNARPAGDASSCPPRLRHAGQHRADAPGRRGPAGRGPAGHALHEDPRRGSRRRQEAVPAEGHRPGPPGLDPRPAVRRRRRRARPHAARLHAEDPQEDEGRRPARRAVRPGPRGSCTSSTRSSPATPRPRSGARRARRGGGRRETLVVVTATTGRAPLAAQPADVHLLSPDQLNTYDVLVNERVVFTRRRWRSSSPGRSARRSAPRRRASRQLREEGAPTTPDEVDEHRTAREPRAAGRRLAARRASR